MQSREGQFHLRLHACRARHPAPRTRRPPGQVIHQYGLTHARIAAHHQGPALTGPDRVDQPVERIAFGCRSVSPVTRACGPGFAVIGPALRRVPVAWLDVSAHTASRLVHHESDEAKTDGNEHLRCHQWRLPLTTTPWPVSESWLPAPP